MKKINIIAAAVAIVLSASCDRKVEFPHATFATFDAVSYNVDENIGTVLVPVSIYNPTGSEVQITVKAADGKAVNGVDYEVVSPASGILSFSGETTTQNVEIKVTDKTGEFTGGKDFTLSIASATQGVTVGNLNVAYFTIKDLDHPLSAFIGEWAGTIAGAFQAPSYNMSFTIAADDNDPNFKQLIFSSGLDPFFVSNGYASASYVGVAQSATEVAVLAEQPVGYQDVVLIGFNNADPDVADDYDDIRFVLNEDGTLTLTTAYGGYTPSQGGFYEIYYGGATFTKK